MRLLVATDQTQGQRANDFAYCVPGELVRFGVVCGRDRDDPDGGCGCGRAFTGMASSRGTTTAVVGEVDTTRAELVDAVRAALERDGWRADRAERMADKLIGFGQRWPVGTVVERRLDAVRVRD